MKEDKPITLNDVLRDDKFREILQTRLNIIKNQIKTRPQPPQGYKYKITGVDLLIKNGCFTVDYFIKIIPEILEKKSDLSYRQRGVIKAIFIQSVNEYLKLKAG